MQKNPPSYISLSENLGKKNSHYPELSLKGCTGPHSRVTSG